jgi:predicted P-loop ATPase
MGWSEPTRDSWEELERTYRAEYGVGVRLGGSSDLGNGYLANIDIDIKSDDPRHKKEALRLLHSKYPNAFNICPIIKTSYGYRLLVRTEEPSASGKLGASSETCIVKLPTTEINRRQQQAVLDGLMTKTQLDEGFRIRAAWEVEFMSAGKQVVLPPSIHPETGKRYSWQKPFRSTSEIPLVTGLGSMKRAAGRQPGSSAVYNFTPEEVDFDLDFRLADNMVNLIRYGEGSEDRSADCFLVSMAMLKAGFSDNEVLSVLTDRENYLGETAYDHRQTTGRSNAAGWVRDYCLAKAKRETSASEAFREEATETPYFEGDDEQVITQIKAQKEVLISGMDSSDPDAWKMKIDRTGKFGDGPPKATLGNLILIITNEAGEDIFKKDNFSGREFYGKDAPWLGGVKGGVLKDNDTLEIKDWLGKIYRFEPNTNLIAEAMTVLAERNSFHPVIEEIEALPEWDGLPRIDGWLKKYFQATSDEEYVDQVFRKWLVASITRVYEPGYKFDWMPIFQGKQGTGKSSLGSILFGENYFSDWLPPLSEKDAALGLLGIRCHEFGELESLRRNEIDTIKAFVTRRIDKVRPPYGKRTKEHPRQVVFFGTTNREHYLKDDSGNRRFMPIEVGRLNFKALIRDRDQLWAEALFIYKHGLEDTLYLSGEAEKAAVKIQKEKMVATEATTMCESIIEFMAGEQEKPEGERFFTRRVKLSDLFEPGAPLDRWKPDNRFLQFASFALREVNELMAKGEIFNFGVFKGLQFIKIKYHGVNYWVLRK